MGEAISAAASTSAMGSEALRVLSSLAQKGMESLIAIVLSVYMNLKQFSHLIRIHNIK